jgi:hypothetical protein
MRTTTTSLLAALAVTAALAPAAAQGAVKSGVYSGTHATGKVSVKLGALSGRLIRFSGSAKLACPDGTTRSDTWDIVVYGPKPVAGKVSYSGEGIAVNARFLKKGRVKGTFDREAGGCKAMGVAFTAKR